jgi:glycerol-3-phosphate dehydrogenase (NAD(P)+)
VKLKLKTIGIIGAGAWGTALATVCAHRGRRVLLWSRDAAHAAAINATHENARNLAGIRLADRIHVVTDPAALADADAAIVAVSSRAFTAAAETCAEHLKPAIPLIVATKGIVEDSDYSLCGTARDLYPRTQTYILSGPSFAGDVARGLPAAVVLAGDRHGDVARLGNAIGIPSFRIYFSTDISGVMAGGAIKNVLAIACGMADGMKLGDSARAALVTRGSFELVRLGRKMGGHYETLQGLSGLGDLILTATSRQSRNCSLGYALGEGRKLEEALAAIRGPCEGLNSAPELAELAGKLRDGAPIIAAVAKVLAGQATPVQAMEELLDRPLKFETVTQALKTPEG